jgi:hypothetical protein
MITKRRVGIAAKVLVAVAIAGAAGVAIADGLDGPDFPKGCTQELGQHNGDQFYIIYCDQRKGFTGESGSYGFYIDHIEGYEGPWHMSPAGADAGLR